MRHLIDIQFIMANAFALHQIGAVLRANSCIGLLLIFSCTACAQPSPANEFQRELTRVLHGGAQSVLVHQGRPSELGELRAAYESRLNKAFWTAEGCALRHPALELLQLMSTAADQSLDPDDNEAARITEAADATLPVSDTRCAQIDLALSLATIRYIHDLHFGRVDPKAAGFEIPARAPLKWTQLLETLAAAQNIQPILVSLEPTFNHYWALKKAFTRYRALASQTALTQLPPLPAKSVKPGELYQGAPALRTLLRELGDLPAGMDSQPENKTLDSQLTDALRHFQFRHGLVQDGALGRETWRQLTTPLAVRVRQIELTLERWRWLPPLDAPTIIVNIPQFRLFAFPGPADSEAQMVTMDVIVGRAFPGAQTPVFAADMKYVKFRPYWDVPYSIMKNEILPHLRVDPAYLQKHNMEIVASQDDRATAVEPTQPNLAALAMGKLRVRQRPGDDNPLGLVKFMLPNSHNVYLHSTPIRRLFGESRRAFSHGCIRVSDPAGLAEYVLRRAAGTWDRDQIEAAMHGTDNVRVDLKQWIHVMIVYGTAVATETGNVYFFDDLYGHDARLAKLLELRK